MDGEGDDCWYDGCDTNSDELLGTDGSGASGPGTDDQAPTVSISLCFPACNDDPTPQIIGGVPGADSSGLDGISDLVTPDPVTVTPGGDTTGTVFDTSGLDHLQTGLAIVGFIPVIGDIANLANAGISLARGDYGNAALYALSAIPIAGVIGEAAIAAKEVSTAEKAAVAAEKFVFYSGEGALDAATKFGEEEGATTIWGSIYGDAFNAGEATGEEASAAFARNASGEVHIFSTDPFTNYGNILYNTEMPILYRNPNVTKFIFHTSF
jgi:hypothetical protein